jgi:large subunit ribosomal protein L32
MTAHPKRKYSKARQGERRSHLHLNVSGVSPCPQCHEVRLSHTVCPHCGTYNGRQVVEVKSTE